MLVEAWVELYITLQSFCNKRYKTDQIIIHNLYLIYLTAYRDLFSYMSLEVVENMLLYYVCHRTESARIINLFQPAIVWLQLMIERSDSVKYIQYCITGILYRMNYVWWIADTNDLVRIISNMKDNMLSISSDINIFHNACS